MKKTAFIGALTLIVQSAFASSIICDKLFSTQDLVIAGNAAGLATVIKSSTRDLVSDALVRDFNQRFDSGPINKMRELGVTNEQMTNVTRPALLKVLEDLKKGQAPLKLSSRPFETTASPSNVLNPKKSIADFEVVHNLQQERLAVTKIIEFGQSGNIHASGISIDALKIAILSGQTDLARQFFTEALRYNNISELTKLAVEINDNEMLIQIGRLSIARYLFVNRNPNYIHEGFNALIEITGPLKSKAVSLLLDFSDLNLSADIKNDKLPFGDDISDYFSNALDSLIAASTLKGRFKRDSVSFYYSVETKDEAILSRMRALLPLMIANKYYGKVLQGAQVVGDPELCKSIADYLYTNRFELSKNEDVFRQKQSYSFNFRYGLDFALASNDRQYINQYLDKMFAEPQEQTSFFFGGEDSVLLSVDAINIAITYIKNRLGDKGVSTDKGQFPQNLLTALEKGLKTRVETDINLKREEHFIYRDRFRHELKQIEYAFQQKPIGSGGDDMWWNLWEAVRQRDIPGVRKIYDLMMTNGRGVDAAYAAMAIAALENGGNTKAIESALKNKPRLQLR